MLSGLFMVNKFTSTDILYHVLSHRSIAWMELNQSRKIWFMSSSVVTFFVNLVCFLLELTYSRHYTWYPKYILPVICVIAFIEVMVVSYITSKHYNCFGICRIALHSCAYCNIVWFVHRVGNCFLVSVYFIAVAPAQTFAAITLCLSFLFMFLVFASIGLQTIITMKESARTNYTDLWKSLCKGLFIIFILILVIAVLIFFTLIFMDLAQHGMSSSTFGSAILTFFISFIVLLVSLVVKNQMSADDTDDKDEEAKLIN